MLRIGLEFSDAERILVGHGAKETALAVAPPQSASGGDMEVVCFSLPDDRAVCLAHDVVGGKDEVVDMELLTDMEKPKSQRKTEKVREIDLRSR